MLTVGTLLQRSFQVTFQQPGVFFSIALLTHAPLILFTILSYQTAYWVKSRPSW